MGGSGTTRKLTTALLMVALALWAEVGVAQVQGDQVLQCSMSVHDMQAMHGVPCCPMDDLQSPATSQERPSCCSVSDAPEQPLGFVVSAQQGKAPSVEVAAVLPAVVTAPAVNRFGTWRSANAPRFVKPVLELKTDLRI
jgi:hypothetical protein